MPRDYRIALIALGLILFCASGQAQEQAGEREREAQQQQAPTQIAPIPLPIEIVEDQPAAEARERHEAEARQREIDDLIAQQGMNAATQAMNEATQDMRDDTRIQTWLIGTGTALLIATLLLTWQANRAAVRAVTVTEEIGQRQLRAYVGVEAVHAYLGEKGPAGTVVLS